MEIDVCSCDGIALLALIGAVIVSPAAAQSAPPWAVTDETGQWAGTIRFDTLAPNPIGNGSVIVCHQSEHGPSCNKWIFDCKHAGTFARTDYFPAFMQGPNGRPSTKEQVGEMTAMTAVAEKLPAIACRLR
jgi:hypothetical protein